MFLQPPYTPGYSYQGETVTVESALTAQQHAGCFAAAGLPAPAHDPDQQWLDIEPPHPGCAEALRRYLREQGVEHHSEIALSYDPHDEHVREYRTLLAVARQDPIPPGRLAQDAAELVARHLGDAAAVALLLAHQRPGEVRSRIQNAQAAERLARELAALATGRRVEEGVLDDAVHDSYAAAASAINNEGLPAQVRCLVECGLDAAARELIEEARSPVGS